MIDKPLINIITRVTRPKYFEVLERSIDIQTYDNFQWILGSDNNAITGDDVVKLTLSTDKPDVIPNGMYFAPYNLHCNTLASYCEEGWVHYMDEDDCYVNSRSLEKIASHCVDEDSIVVWKAQITPTFIVPNHSFGKTITAGDFSGIAFAFHTKHLPVKWTNLSYGDYRAGKELENRGLKIRWVNEVLTRTQAGPHSGKI
jgi:hypothetical protein